MPANSLVLHPDNKLKQLLPRNLRRKNTVVYPLTRRASIKDIIESLHVPHTEIGSIIVNNRQVTFGHIPQAGEQIFLHAFTATDADMTRPCPLRPGPFPGAAFMVDVNVGKLALLLRMSGIDTWYDARLNEADLARRAADRNRILLSRNRDLLQRKIVTWGHLVRAQHPEEQLAEVITLFQLHKSIKPFSRCLECNTRLQPVEKSTILHRLEPLTRKYYQRFYRCPDCDKIYWQGSHQQHMERRLRKILSIP